MRSATRRPVSTVPGGFYGFAAGNQTGFSVSTANDFNNDGFPDIQIGTPGVNVGTLVGAGEATVIYSEPFGPPLGIYTMPTPGGFPFPIKSTGAFIPATNFLGEVAGAMTGYSVGFTGPLITADATPRILVARTRSQ